MADSHGRAGEHERAAGELDELIAGLAGKDPIARQKARHALVATGQAATAPLIAALGNTRTQVRWEAAKALVRLADATAAPALVAALEDKDTGVRWLAAEALIAVGSPALPALLQALVDRSNSTWLLEGTHHVLHTLQATDIGPVVRPVVTALEHSAREEAAPVAAHEALQQLEEGA